MTSNHHTHSHREILVPIEGDHFYGVRDRLFRARPGSVLLFDHQEPHDRFYSPYQPALRDLWIFFSSPRQALFSEFALAAEKKSHPLKKETDASRRVSFLRRKVISGPFVEAVTASWDHCARAKGSVRAVDQLKASVTALLLHAEPLLLRPPIKQGGSLEQQRIVAYIQEHVRQHPGDPHSVEALARLAGYAPTYFHRLFKATTGERLHAFVNTIRLEQAQLLLAEGRTVESVSEELGFATAAYFSRFFKQATGRPPSQWKPL